jgi:chemotaxis protein MotB
MARKKKKHGEAHENAERWLLTYADMITLLMLFFIVLWSMSQVDQEKYQKVSEALENVLGGGDLGIFNWNGGKPSPGMLDGTPRQTARPSTQRSGTGKVAAGGASALLSRAMSVLQSLIKDGTARVSEDERGTTVTIAADVGFAADSSRLGPEGSRVVQQIADMLAQIPNKVVVEGHTDAATRASGIDDWELSAMRALAVRSALETYGVAPERMSATAYGSTKALRSNNTPEGRAYNRRVEILIVNEADQAAAAAGETQPAAKE